MVLAQRLSERVPSVSTPSRVKWCNTIFVVLIVSCDGCRRRQLQEEDKRVYPSSQTACRGIYGEQKASLPWPPDRHRWRPSNHLQRFELTHCDPPYLSSISLCRPSRMQREGVYRRRYYCPSHAPVGFGTRQAHLKYRHSRSCLGIREIVTLPTLYDMGLIYGEIRLRAPLASDAAHSSPFDACRNWPVPAVCSRTTC